MINKIVLYLFFISCSFASGWQLEKKVDSMTDNVTKSAVTESAEGHRFTVYKVQNGESIWVNFSLPEKSFDTLNFEKPALFRIDKENPYNPKLLVEYGRLLKKDVFEWQPQWINFRINDSIDNPLFKNFNLNKFMEGKKIVVRYFLSTGGYKETFFSLKGSSTVLKSTFNLK